MISPNVSRLARLSRAHKHRVPRYLESTVPIHETSRDVSCPGLLGNITDVALPTKPPPSWDHNLHPARIKVADVGIGPKVGAGKPFFVVETGFSQPYNDLVHVGLLQDATQWLEQTRGEVKCVVLVKIHEGKIEQVPAVTQAQTIRVPPLSRHSPRMMQSMSNYPPPPPWYTNSPAASPPLSRYGVMTQPRKRNPGCRYVLDRTNAINDS